MMRKRTDPTVSGSMTLDSAWYLSIALMSLLFILGGHSKTWHLVQSAALAVACALGVLVFALAFRRRKERHKTQANRV